MQRLFSWSQIIKQATHITRCQGPAKPTASLTQDQEWLPD